jgi:formate-dependent nitrite reductase membrane component NrfD
MVSVFFAILTAIVLVADLERPERFYLIITRPNWSSWLARGAFLLTAHSMIASIWILLGLMGWTEPLRWLAPLALVASFAATAYTGFLFAQGLARDLWQGPHNTIDLIAQAAAEGAAALLVAGFMMEGTPATMATLALTLAIAAAAHLIILLLEHVFTPSPTVHHELAVRAIRRGPYATLFWLGAIGLGCLAPIALIWLAASFSFPTELTIPAALIALAGGFAWEYIWVEAGQSVPNS